MFLGLRQKHEGICQQQLQKPHKRWLFSSKFKWQTIWIGTHVSWVRHHLANPKHTINHTKGDHQKYWGTRQGVQVKIWGHHIVENRTYFIDIQQDLRRVVHCHNLVDYHLKTPEKGMKSANMEGLARNQKGFDMIGQDCQPTPFQLEQPVLPGFVAVKWALQFQNLLHLNLDTLMHHNHKCSMEWGSLNLEVPHQSHQCEFLNGLESNQKATVYRRSKYMLFLKPCSFRSQAGYLLVLQTQAIRVSIQ